MPSSPGWPIGRRSSVTNRSRGIRAAARSWEGLDPDVVILNWNGARKEASLRFFAARGHRQIVAGYYDGDPVGILV